MHEMSEYTVNEQHAYSRPYNTKTSGSRQKQFQQSTVAMLSLS